MSRRHDAEMDAYWADQADKAHAERVADCAARLKENGGRLEPWMIFTVGPLDLKRLISSLPQSLTPDH